MTDRAGEIGVRYSTFVGSPPPAAVTASVAALSSTAQRWVLYGLSVLQRNAAAASSLNRADAVARLIARAPAATTDPTTGGHDFEDEVIRVSGWAESALTGRLTAPTGDRSDDDPRRSTTRRRRRGRPRRRSTAPS